MRYFRKIVSGLNVAPVRQQLETQPELWNVHPDRLAAADGPFAGTSDIWLRYRAHEELTSPESFCEPHFAVFYPAWHALPGLHQIVFSLMRMVDATYLGGVLITKIPAGGQIKPHHDQGSWHASEMRCKVYVPIQANHACVNYCGDESMVIEEGEAVVFDNQIIHSVVNRGDTDRITAIICLKTS